MAKTSSTVRGAVPATRRAFENTADEKEYLRAKAEAWLARAVSARARYFARRLKEVVEKEGYSQAAVCDQNDLAFCAEVMGDWKDAATFRKREVEAREAALSLAKRSDMHTRTMLRRHFPRSELREAVEAWQQAAERAGLVSDVRRARALKRRLR